MSAIFSRRDFLKVGLASMGGAGLVSLDYFNRLPEDDRPIGLGRAAVQLIGVFQEASYRSKRVGWLHRDDVVPLYDEIISPAGPTRNPRWYRVSKGYVHSSRIQRVEGQHLNSAVENIPAPGLLAEVTVPYTPTYRHTLAAGWQPLYRLYYASTHWITALEYGPDGHPWYRIQDHYPEVAYHVRASHMRPIYAEEYSPIATDVPDAEKCIVVNLDKQSLTAFEGDQAVYQTKVSSGVHTEDLEKDELPTDTPVGNFRVCMKMPSRHMGNAELTSDLEAYELPGVPWTMVFHEIGVALHGAFWHDNFGIKMSHGCVNLCSADALWLFRWTTPVFDPSSWYQSGSGTRVMVVEGE